MINDEKLVPSLDLHFLTLTNEPSPASEVAKLPEIDAIKSNKIVVDVNLDGSAMETAFKATAPILLNAGTALMAAFWIFFDAVKRENIEVSIVTTQGTYLLDRVTSPNVDVNFVGRYSTTSTIPLNSIQSIKIKNTNAEASFSVLIPDPKNNFIPKWVEIDVNNLIFTDIKAKVSVKNKASYSSSLPNLSQLENERTITSNEVIVNSNNSKTINWNIASRLTGQFEGIYDKRDELETELADEALTEAKIENLLGFMNANKYGFTRLVLQNTEREQLINVLEDLKIGDVELSSVVGTSPLGFCGNHVILPLKKCKSSDEIHEPITIDVSKLRLEMNGFEMAGTAEPEALNEYLTHIKTMIETFISKGKNKNKLTLSDIELLRRLSGLSRKLEEIIILTTPSDISDSKVRQQVVPERLSNAFRAVVAEVESLWRFVDTPVQVNQTDISKLCGYYVDIHSALKDRMGELLSSSEVSLPSPAVFMEPVLSNAKGAELYDMRRNSHYEILPSPGILPTDPNMDRSEEIVLTSNVPPSNLTIQNVPNYRYQIQ